MPDSFRSRRAHPDAAAARLLRQAHNRDGLPEIAVGVSFLFASGLLFAQAMLPRTSLGFRAALLAYAFLFPVLCLGGPRALRWLRTRYPTLRVGYVPKPISRKPVVLGIACAALVISALFTVIERFAHPDGWILAGTGLAGGALMAAIGIAVALAGVPLPLGFALLFGFDGLLAFVSGAVIFVHFLRHPIESGA